MRYTKYPGILTLCLLSLALSLVQCNKETTFNPYPCISGQVVDAVTEEPVADATVRLWIDGLSTTDTLTYVTDSQGSYSTERISTWFDKPLTLEASKLNPPPGVEHYAPVRTSVSPYVLSTKTSLTSDTLYVNFELYPAYSAWHIVIPEKLDFTDGETRSYFMIINNGFDVLYWELGENNTEWMSVFWIEIYNTVTDIHHLKRGGYVRFQVRINRDLLTTGSYDSSILVITDQGNTVIPVHVIVE